MEATVALKRLQEAAALWSADFITAAEVVEVACDLLVAGHDNETLGMLAAVSARHADIDVPEILPLALEDLSLEHYERFSRAGQEAALHALAARVMAGEMPPMDLAVWAHSRFGHDTLELAGRLAELDDAYDTIEYTHLTEAQINADILAEARRIVATT